MSSPPDTPVPKVEERRDWEEYYKDKPPKTSKGKLKKHEQKKEEAKQAEKIETPLLLRRKHPDEVKSPILRPDSRIVRKNQLEIEKTHKLIDEAKKEARAGNLPNSIDVRKQQLERAHLRQELFKLEDDLSKRGAARLSAPAKSPGHEAAKKSVMSGQFNSTAIFSKKKK